MKEVAEAGDGCELGGYGISRSILQCLRKDLEVMEDAVFVSDDGMCDIVVSELDSVGYHKGSGGGVQELESTVVEEIWDNVKSVVTTEVPGFTLYGPVVDDEGASKRAEWSGIKVEGAVVVFPGRNGGVQGILAEKFQVELVLREQLVPQVVG